MIDCAFKGHTCRADICLGDAASFFRTANGTMWPLCHACSDKHKDISLNLAKGGQLAVGPLVGATFDIPLDDSEALTAWRAQDPERILEVIRRVDAHYTQLDQFVQGRRG